MAKQTLSHKEDAEENGRENTKLKERKSYETNECKISVGMQTWITSEIGL